MYVPFQVSTYTPHFENSLVAVLRFQFGGWWKDPLFCMADGMDTLPKSFLQKNTHGWNKTVDLSKHIKFGIRVEKVSVISDFADKKVTIEGTNVAMGTTNKYTGDAVFLCVPLHVLRQIDVPLSLKKQQAIAGISYEASTKILLQCKTRFWQKEVGR